jgi:hypothetical protein
MALLRLKGPQLLEFRDLLQPAFPRQRFEELLVVLDRSVDEFAGTNDTYPATILKTLQYANAQLWWRDLMREACNAVADPELRRFANEVGFAADVVAAERESVTPLKKARELELKIRASGSTFDIVTWRQRLAEIEDCVCRIEYPELEPHGTGFLVGPDLVLTNYHVIESLHRGTVEANQAVCRFDYKVLHDGISVGPGKPYGLANDWLVDHSLYSTHDFEVQPTGEVAGDELDYALLRISTRVGGDRVAGEVQAFAGRNWIQVPQAAPDFKQAPALYVVQHPDGKPMQIALDSNAVIAATATRVRYTTTTEPGSSGSPCFNARWDWVAVHHSGDPKYWTEGKKPDYNQGIPVTAIISLLKQRGKAHLLGVVG